ncbi:MAG: acetyl-CoA hydrolase/transferase C-terminal domain-containing protein [Acidimicrobiales bacterium]|jgi:acyl CoA:acetate/3-ketoacid CoA transferase beta subunit
MTARELCVEDAIALVRPVDTLGLGLVTSTPVGLLKELSNRQDWEDLTVSGGLILGVFDVFLHPNVHYRSSFYGGGERHYQSQGADIQFVPSFFRHYGLLIQHLAPRVMMMQGAMPDANGNVSLSLYNGAHLAEFLAAGRDPNRVLIVECSPHFPRTLALEGFSNEIALEDIDVVVYSDEYPTALGKDVSTSEDMAIADYAAAFVHDGCTLQTGIGAVPNLVAEALVRRDGGDYGVHSEMFTDGLYQLCASGKVTNARKPIHRGDSVITFALGSQDMYEFLNENERVRLAPVAYVNDPSVIAKNHRMVSINSALEVDLQGQIIADTVGARQYSGVGGHMDFVEGTSLSLEHTSLICLQSTAVVNGVLKSRIIGDMSPHSVVTTPRHLAGVIVTEHGFADLRGRSVKERARAMVNIAHPQFRDELADAAELLGR